MGFQPRQSTLPLEYSGNGNRAGRERVGKTEFTYLKFPGKYFEQWYPLLAFLQGFITFFFFLTTKKSILNNRNDATRLAELNKAHLPLENQRVPVIT